MTRGRRPEHREDPSKQLQIQRAFRKRRADYFREVEETVKRLECENEELRRKHKQQGSERKGKAKEESDDWKQSGIERKAGQGCGRRKCPLMKRSDEQTQTQRLADIRRKTATLSNILSTLQARLDSERKARTEIEATLRVNSRVKEMSLPGQQGIGSSLLSNPGHFASSSSHHRHQANQNIDDAQIWSTSRSTLSLGNTLLPGYELVRQAPMDKGHAIVDHTSNSRCCLDFDECRPDQDCLFISHGTSQLTS